jgi:hypothetical protein
MADDFEDWEHVAAGVGETTGNPVDEDAVQLELELLLDEGLVKAFAVSSSGTEGRLVWTDPDRSHLREEWTYWFTQLNPGCGSTATQPALRFQQSSSPSKS